MSLVLVAYFFVIYDACNQKFLFNYLSRLLGADKLLNLFELGDLARERRVGPRRVLDLDAAAARPDGYVGP